MFAMANLGGWMADWLIAAGNSVGTALNAVDSVVFWSTMVLLLLMPAAKSVTQGLLVLTLCLGLCVFSLRGVSVHHMDIAPQYAGIVMGIGNTAGTVSGIVGVSATGLNLESAGGSKSRVGWYQAHEVAAGILVTA
jgi:MFS transporter, ACS family, solute carrier family 17 (sodium-dependent inorganic phosphate cotransporter), other